MHRIVVFAVVIASISLLPATVLGGDNDFKIHRLTSCVDGTVQNSTCVALRDNDAFSTFSQALGLVFMPSFLSPAESLGEAGFAIGVESKFSTPAENDHWRALERNVGAAVAEAPLFTTLQLHVRKGLPLSFEIEAAMSWLVESELFYLGGGIKWAFTEGWDFLPDLSVRGHGGAMTGNNDLNLINAGVDISLSYEFGIAGTFSLTPYAGYSHVWTIASSRVIDADPGTTITPSGGYAPETVFEQRTLTASRGFVGLRAIVDYFTFTFEANFAGGMQNYAINLGTDF